VNTETVLKLMFELRAVLDRIGRTDFSLYEALSHDVDRAVRLTDSCIAQLTESAPEGDEEDDE